MAKPLGGRRVALIVVTVFFLVVVGYVGTQFPTWTASRNCTTSIHPSTFSDRHVAEGRGRIVVETPEVYELLNVALALTDAAAARNLIDSRGHHYQLVLDRFAAHRSHPFIGALERSLDRFPSHRGLFAYRFEGDRIIADPGYGLGWRAEVFADLVPLMEDFARVTGYREFYAEYRPYYQGLAEEYAASVPLEAMRRWLEAEFPQSRDAYRVVISPLVGGHHNTFLFRDRAHDYHEIVMFVPAAGSGLDPVAAGVAARVVFTEIDHNYVNPATDDPRHLGRIHRIFSDLEAWNSGPGYGDPGQTFNEYMTWAVFTLWAHDTYTPEVFRQVNSITVEVMGQRGFIRFTEFNQALLELYRSRSEGVTVFDLYPEILDWADQAG